jgi:cation transport ATPase
VAKDSPQKRLAKLRKEVRAETGKSKARRTNQARHAPRKKRERSAGEMRASAIALRVAAVAAVIALPFFVYVRASVFLYSSFGWPPWLAVGGAITLVLALVSLYATWLARRVTATARASQLARLVAVPMVAAFLLYSLAFLARVNAKTDDVQSYYWSLHPVLRVAVSTVMIIDQTAVITDMQRAPQDYARMGLKVNNRTRHYMQADGWVHAVDIRTKGRGEPRNLALQLYFWSMGFSTLRHIGTADHLHVQLR